MVLAGSLYYFFGSVDSAAKLVPAETMLYVELDPTSNNLSPDSEGEGYLKGLGGLFWQSFSSNNPFFSYEDDVQPWIGEELVLMKKSPDLLDPFIILAEVGDKKIALDTVERLKEKFGDGENATESQRYKGIEIFAVDQPVPVAACYLKGYVVISASVESVKEIIDVSGGEVDSLSQDKYFQDLQKNLDNENLSMLVSLRLRQALEATTSTLGVSEQLFAKQLNFPPEMLLGIAMWQEDGGIRLATHVATARLESLPEAKPHLEYAVPSTAIAYYEGRNFAALLTEFAGNDLAINFDSLSWLSESYIISLLPQSGTRRSAFGLVIEVDNDETAWRQLREAEPLIIAGLTRLGISGEGEFQDGDIEGQATRYISLTEGIKMNLNYTVLDNKIIITTSPDALSMMLDANEGNTSSVADDELFAGVVEKVSAPQQVGFFYVNTDALGEFSKTAETDEINILPDESLEEQPGFIESLLEPFAGMGLSAQNTGTGSFLTEIYLPYK